MKKDFRECPFCQCNTNAAAPACCEMAQRAAPAAFEAASKRIEELKEEIQTLRRIIGPEIHLEK